MKLKWWQYLGNQTRGDKGKTEERKANRTAGAGGIVFLYFYCILLYFYLFFCIFFMKQGRGKKGETVERGANKTAGGRIPWSLSGAQHSWGSFTNILPSIIVEKFNHLIQFYFVI